MKTFKKLTDKIKNVLEKEGKKKMVENCIIALVIGVIILIAGGSLFKTTKAEQKSEKIIKQVTENSSPVFNAGESQDCEKKMGNILSKILGAGKVEVMITYDAGKERILAYDDKKNLSDTNESDTGGGSRKINQNNTESTVVFEDEENGVKKPVIVKEIEPVVKGVVIVADGAKDPVVKEALCNAVKVLMNVPVHKIQVFTRNK